MAQECYKTFAQYSLRDLNWIKSEFKKSFPTLDFNELIFVRKLKPIRSPLNSPMYWHTSERVVERTLFMHEDRQFILGHVDKEPVLDEYYFWRELKKTE